MASSPSSWPSAATCRPGAAPARLLHVLCLKGQRWHQAEHGSGLGEGRQHDRLPRYAKQAVDQQFARWVMLHVQSNPLPICTRPRVLIKGKRT